MVWKIAGMGSADEETVIAEDAEVADLIWLVGVMRVAKGIAVDRCGHPTGLGLDYSCWEVSDRGIHHWPVVPVPSNYATSCDDFETIF